MSNYLTEIIKDKKKALEENYGDINVDQHKNTPAGAEPFYNRVKAQTSIGVIAEFKRASPSKGILKENGNPREVAKLYDEAGADGISVLTDGTHFRGSFQDLAIVRDATALPILCKDFILEEKQITWAYRSGANMILLIARMLIHDRLQELYTYAIDLGLEVLLEIHDEQDLEKARPVNPKIIGINNRNLRGFETDLAVTERLSPKIDIPDAIIISESGIKTIADCKRAVAAGADAVLVGEAFMRSEDPGELLRGMKKLKRSRFV